MTTDKHRVRVHTNQRLELGCEWGEGEVTGRLMRPLETVLSAWAEESGNPVSITLRYNSVSQGDMMPPSVVVPCLSLSCPMQPGRLPVRG